MWGTAAFQAFGPSSPFLLASLVMAGVTVLTLMVPVPAAAEPAPAD
jgi:hypothetical protein